MLFVGNQRGGGRDLAQHLLKDDNERVQVHDIRGFASNDLESAFKESYAMSRATKCKQHLFSLSINPPPTEEASNEDFENTIKRAEERLGLSGQPRAIVFHEKKSRDGEVRRHAHAIWCRINTEEMKAVQLSFTKDKLMKLSREIYVERDWRMPPGMLNKPDRDPRNFTFEQWQQAKRSGNDPQKLIGIFQDCWSVSDTKETFAHALAEHGYVLAHGRRGLVGVDHDGEVYAVSKWTKKKAKDVRDRLGTPDGLPSVEEAQKLAAQRISDRLKEIQAEKDQEERLRLERLEEARHRQDEMHKAAWARLAREQAIKQYAEQIERTARLRKGLLGILDRLTGQRRKALEENANAARDSLERDRQQRVAVVSRQDAAKKQVEQKAQSVKAEFQEVQSELCEDIDRITHSREDRIQAAQDRIRQNRQRSRQRTRNRDGPGLER